MAKTNDFLIYELADIERQMKILTARKKAILEEVEQRWEQLKDDYRNGKYEMEVKENV